MQQIISRGPALIGAVLLIGASVALAQELRPGAASAPVGEAVTNPQATSKPESGSEVDKLKTKKLMQEIAKLEIENSALGVKTRRWSVIFGMIGGVFGACLTAVLGYASYKLNTAQDARLQQEERLTQKRLDQDRELEREKQTLEVFRDLGSENPRIQIAAASLLHQRLKSYERKNERELLEELERQTIIKVLVSVLKKENEAQLKKENEAQSEGLDTLRKYIGDNLIDLLIKGEMREYDWQNTNLSYVWWKGVDASGVDFYEASFRKAGLREANLEGAVFYEADLTEAVLRDALLAGANFSGATLNGANLSGATYDGANFSGATYDEKTIWPEGFFPTDFGARLTPSSKGR